MSKSPLFIYFIIYKNRHTQNIVKFIAHDFKGNEYEKNLNNLAILGYEVLTSRRYKCEKTMRKHRSPSFFMEVYTEMLMVENIFNDAKEKGINISLIRPLKPNRPASIAT